MASPGPVGAAAHADWSVDPRKRWLCLAVAAPGGWQLGVEPVGDARTLLDRLRAVAGGGAVALGVDFPIGLPRAYAARHCAQADFPGFLRTLDRHSPFFQVGATLDDTSPDRPFYPARGRAGMTRLSHAEALGLADGAALSRACDRATAERPAGAPLFWTLGANQSGKAAIHAWQSLLIPALAGPHPPALWPFDGPLLPLLRPGRVAVAETYPAEALRQLGLRLVGSKRRQADRQALSAPLRAAMDRVQAAPDPALGAQIAAGFGADAAGEDRLDCVLGCLCVLGVLAGLRPDGAPDDSWITRWEGWVLGQTALPRPSASAASPPQPG